MNVTAPRSDPSEDGNRGVVFNITKYMLEDGPGIRTAVFLKSCPLRCLWCSNPLGQSHGPSVVYLKPKCVRCQACVEACSHNALFIDQEGTVARNLERCANCGECVGACPVGARELRGTVMTVREVLAKVEQDQVFYRRGNGGVTLSGGEILMQAAFASNILRGAWDRFIHTAVETCALGAWDDLQSILAYSNVAFIDIKHMDSDVHKRLTGHSNRQILQNIQRAASYLSSLDRQLIIRLAVVPGVNDSRANLENIASFLSRLKGNIELNLLPYHRYGVSKYDWIGLKYELVDVQPPSHARLEELADFFTSRGITCSCGGGEIRSVLT